MKFFDPSDEFIKWLAEYSNGRTTFDVGSGDGHVVQALHKHKVGAIGIDPMWSPDHPNFMNVFNAILPMHAQECSLIRKENLLLLFCRPCHSGFVGETVDLMHPSSEALYISKPSNVMVDLVDFEYEEVDAPACPEEKVYRIGKRIREAEGVSFFQMQQDFKGARESIRKIRHLVGLRD